MRNHTPAGAFKVRGGIGLCGLPETRAAGRTGRGDRDARPITGSPWPSHVAARTSACVVVVPFGNSTEKNRAYARAFGAELIEARSRFRRGARACVEIARERGYEYGNSFAKPLVVGVATYAHELFTAEPNLRCRIRADRSRFGHLAA